MDIPRANKALKIIGIAAGVPALCAGAFALASRAIWHRSSFGTVSELSLRTSGVRNKMENDIEFDNYVLKRAEANEERYVLPSIFTPRVTVTETEVAGMQVFSLNKRAINDRAVIYLHGGSFMGRPRLETWRFLDILAHKTRAEVIVPLYPLAPVHSYKEAYEAIEAVWNTVGEQYGAGNITIMGASSGGGLAAGFVEQLVQEGKATPKNLVLISPWVDMTFRNPDIRSYEGVDPALSLTALKKIARLWSNGDDLADYHLSPALGEVRGLPQLEMFIGTREVYYPDAKLFYERAHAVGVRGSLHEGRGLNHLYPFMPIPEGNKALDEIVEIVTED